METAVRRMARLLEHLATARPAALVLVASLVGARAPNDYGLCPAAIEAFNGRLAVLVARQAAAGRNTQLVDLHVGAALAAGGLSADGLHPNDNGYRRMATVWHEALLPHLARLR